MGKIIGYFENYDPSDSAALYEAHGYAGVLSACTLVLAILHHLYFYHVQCAGMRLRVAMCHMIYRKVSVTKKVCTSHEVPEASWGSSLSITNFITSKNRESLLYTCNM